MVDFAIAQIIVSFIIAIACIIIGIFMIQHSRKVRSRSLRIKAYFLIGGGCIFSVGLFWPATAYFYTELLWFQHLNYDGVFTKIIKTRWYLLFGFAAVAAGFMGVNLLIANRLCPISKEFRRWTRGSSITTHVSAIVVMLIIAVIMGIPMMWLWEEVLLYKNKVTVGENEISTVDINTGDVTAMMTGQARPRGLAFDEEDNLYVSGIDQVFKFNPETHIFATVASELSGPRGLVFNNAGTLYVVESDTGEISEIQTDTGEAISLVTGLSRPMSIAFDQNGVLYVAEADSGEISIVKDLTIGAVTLVSGLKRPMSIAFDRNGLLYVAETESGIISTVDVNTGAMTPWEVGDLSHPVALAFDENGMLYVAGMNEIYTIDPRPEVSETSATKIITLSTGLSRPMSLAFDSGGALYVAEWGSGQISTINVKNGNMTAMETEFTRSVDIIFDQQSAMYVASDNEVFKVNISTGALTVIAGERAEAQSEAKGKQSAKKISRPRGLAYGFDTPSALNPADAVSEVLYVTSDDKVFKVDLKTKEYTEIARGLSQPRGLALGYNRDNQPILYVAEFGSNEISKITDLSGSGNLKKVSVSIITPKKERRRRATEVLKEALKEGKRLKDKRKWLFEKFESGVDMFDEAVLENENDMRPFPLRITLQEQEQLQNISDTDKELLRSLSEDLSSPMALTLDREGRCLYVAEWRIGQISKINVKTGVLTKVAEGLSSPKDLTFDNDGRELYVAESGSGDISIVDAETGRRRILVSGLSSPTCLAFPVREAIPRIGDRNLSVTDNKLYIAESIDTDPFFNTEIGYYMFTFPIHKWVSIWAKVLVWITLFFMAWIYNYYYSRDPHTMPRARRAMFIHGTVFWLMLAAVSVWRSRINIRQLLLHQRGGIWSAKVYGIGAADTQQVIAYEIFMFIVIGIAVIAFANVFWHKRFLWYAGASIWLASYALIVWLYPNLYQRLRVNPTEREIEIPYLKHNINGTRRAYSLDRIKERRFVKDMASLELIKSHPEILRNIQMWDRHVLYYTLGELETYRDYYDFDPDTDVDRYWVEDDDGKLTYRQVMLAAREIYPEGLPTQNWINNQFVYTHGYGVCVTPVNEFTGEGKPYMWLGGIQPKPSDDSPVYEYRGIKITRPDIYYGEMTNDFVFVQTDTEEFDYPELGEGLEGNKYTTYTGNGGVLLGQGFRQYAFYWRFAKLNLLLTRYLRDDSRVMFRRQIEKRARAAAPILKFDPDPFIVIGNSGRLWWVIDTYVVNNNYPYSEPRRHSEYGKFNYIRNAAVAIIDAYNGDVNFYILEEEEPLIQTYRKIFPDLFKPKEDIPDGVAAHLRFPDTLTYIIAQKYTDYHVQDPVEFYDKSDSWNLPQETYYDDDAEKNMRIPMTPYYVMLILPGEDKLEFVNMLPFTPPRRTLNMSAWLVARCDQPHYGEMVVYVLPKGESIDGPEQIEARIESNPQISKDLSLWGQREGGSIVRRGNLLVIPVEDSLFYVEPIFLEEKIEQKTKGRKTRLPLLIQVIVAAEDKLAAAGTFDQALKKIFEEEEEIEEGRKLLFGINLEFQSDLDSKIISEELQGEFENNEITLSDKAKIAIKKEGSRWELQNDKEKYTVRLEEDKINIYGMTKKEMIKNIEKMLDDLKKMM